METTTEQLIKQFIQERNEALLSLDELKIRAMHHKWNEGEDLPQNLHVFWVAVHKAITGAGQLPKEFRRKSKEWLLAHGSTSHDDGDL